MLPSYLIEWYATVSMTDISIKKEIFLKQGKLRKAVLSKLEKPKTATEIANELKKHRSSISRVLLDLEKEGFVKCVNPKDDRYRHYMIK